MRQSKLIVGVVVMLSASTAEAQNDHGDLAKASQNPVGDLITIPFQFNFLSGGGIPDGRTLSNLNIQPVLPIKVGEQWTLIARTIVPWLNIPVSDLTRGKGIGDILQQFFVTPQKPGSLIWGIGPVFSFPTATNDLARTGSWAVGPVAVVMIMPDPFTIGSLIYNLWTFSDEGPGDIEVNQLAWQPFINFNFGAGWALSYSPIITANWDASDDEQWTVPIGLGISKVHAIGKQPLSIGLTYFHNVERPEATGANQLRFVVAVLFPSAKAASPSAKADASAN